MFSQVPAHAYSVALLAAWQANPRIAESCTDYRDPATLIEPDTRCYLADDMRSGYVIRTGGELVGVFSTVRGRGDDIVTDAIRNGAAFLDCFDGYLPKLYARHGFVETDRDPNWTPGGPDIVFMALRHAHRYDRALSTWICDTCDLDTDFCEDVTR